MTANVTASFCNICGLFEPHICSGQRMETMIFSGPVFEGIENSKIIQKLDKIIELLEKSSDEDEDKILSELTKKGLFEQLLGEAKLSSSSSDWQKELDEI